MNAATSASAPQAFQQGVVRTYDFLTPEQDFGARVQEGLSRANKSLPWEILFDTSGVQLFAEACAQPEYLAARIERAILDACIGEIAEFVHGDSQYLDLGCHGVSSAVTLIEHLRPSIYLPVDTSFKALGSRIAQVSQAYPWLNVCGLHARFDEPLHLPRFAGVPVRYKLVSLLGGAFARYFPAEAGAILVRLRALAGPAGRVLVSVDQTTDWQMLQGAYNDRQGCMAAFNLNALAHLNRELRGDWQPHRFRHAAVYHKREGFLEMVLESQFAQFAHVAGRRIDLAPGERVRTAVHCTHAPQAFLALAQQAGLRVEKTWSDTHNLIALHCMVAT